MKITLSKLEASIILRNYFVDKIGLNPFDNDLDVEVVESLTFEREVQEYGESIPKVQTYRGEEITEEEGDKLDFLRDNNTKLYNFLEEKDILLRYVRNHIGDESFENLGADINCISSAFRWEGTEQGFVFWSKVNEEYYDL